MPRRARPRQDWPTRTLKALRRFQHRRRVIETWGRSAEAWRFPLSSISRLQREGVLAARALARQQDDSRHHVIELERVVQELAEADNWTSRLGDRLSRLTSQARAALKGLVRLGCVPDPILECVEEQIRDFHRTAKNRDRLAEHRRQMRMLSRSLADLGRLCADYEGLALDAPGAYPLPGDVSRYLRNQARQLEVYLRTDPRSKRGRSRADALKFVVLRDIKAITGSYQDELFAQLLSSVSPITPHGVRRWRVRETRHWPNPSLPRKDTKP